MESLDFCSKKHPNLGVILTGDFNKLPDSALRSYPLRLVVKGVTCQHTTLDKIYTDLAEWYIASVAADLQPLRPDLSDDNYVSQYVIEPWQVALAKTSTKHPGLTWSLTGFSKNLPLHWQNLSVPYLTCL